jgi:hypothetical protein
MRAAHAHPAVPVFAALLTLAAAACAKEQPMTPEAPPVPDLTGDADLLVEVRAYGHFTGGSGYRVLADGSHDSYRSDRPGVPEWKAGQPLPVEGLARVRAALAAIQPGTLQSRYGPDPGPTDRGDTVWRVRVGDALVRAEVVPGTAVPALDAVADAIRDALAAEFSMVLIVGEGEAAVRHEISPSADTAPVDAVVNALIGSGEEISHCTPASGAARIAAIVWKNPGVPDERQELWDDGLEVWHTGDGSTSCKRHPASLVASVRGQLAAIDWAALTSR